MIEYVVLLHKESQSPWRVSWFPQRFEEKIENIIKSRNPLGGSLGFHEEK